MRFYHRTAQSNLISILAEGLRPGAEVGQGERLSFLMFDRNRYQVTTGRAAYLEVEIDEADPNLHWVNSEWIEYYGRLPVSAIVAVANPPVDNEAAIKFLLADDHTPWTYKPVQV